MSDNENLNAQYFIDALRQGNYSEFLKIVKKVSDKYTAIFNNNPIGADDLLPLLIYELCHTNINIKDTELLNFLYEYIAHQPSLCMGESAYVMTTLLVGVKIALLIKKTEDYDDVIKDIKIENETDFKNFMNDNSSFSRLQSDAQKNNEYSQEISDKLFKQWTDDDLLKYIMNMNGSTFENFQNNIVAISGDTDPNSKVICPFIEFRKTIEELKLLSKEDILRHILKMDNNTFANFHRSMAAIDAGNQPTISDICPLIECRKNIDKLQELINDYKKNLAGKLEKLGYPIQNNKTGEICIEPEQQAPNTEAKKIISKYNAINALKLNTDDSLNPERLEQVRQAATACKILSPAQDERSFIQKIVAAVSDCIHFIHTLMSKDAKLSDEINKLKGEIDTQITSFSP